MKRYLLIFSFLLAGCLIIKGQSSDPLVSDCVLNSGTGAKYLKDFRIQLGKTENMKELRYKANISLWKNTKYRFSMCTADNSKGKLILNVKDDGNKLVLSSYDKNTGKSFASIDFTCNKSGIYQLCYDFENGQQGSGVGVVSMIK